MSALTIQDKVHSIACGDRLEDQDMICVKVDGESGEDISRRSAAGKLAQPDAQEEVDE